MAYNYLELVNEVNRRLNEVELTSTTFATASGFYAHNKDAVNSAIRDIYHNHYEWSFNHVFKEQVLTANTIRYSFPTDANTIDFDSFRIKESTALGNKTQKLTVISYEDYLDRFVDQEYDTTGNQSKLPQYVFHAPSLQYGVVNSPDKAYTLVYEYYKIPDDLTTYDTYPTVPERFKHVIIDGAMYYAYLFRSNEQSANLSKSKFEEGVKRMRIMLVNRYTYMRSGVITPSKSTGFGDRVR
jgi:hypothetical protein